MSKYIIDIPEVTYEEVKWRGLYLCPRDSNALVNAIKTSIPYEPQPHVDCRDRLKEVFREHSSISGDMFHLYQIEQIIDGEPWL